jgi:hypothetical protein
MSRVSLPGCRLPSISAIAEPGSNWVLDSNAVSRMVTALMEKNASGQKSISLARGASKSKFLSVVCQFKSTFLGPDWGAQKPLARNKANGFDSQTLRTSIPALSRAQTSMVHRGHLSQSSIHDPGRWRLQLVLAGRHVS